MRSTCAETTLGSYQKSLRHFIRIMGDHPLDEYERQMIYKFRLQRFDQEDIRKTTINIELRSIKAAFSWVYKNDILQHHPYKDQDFLFKILTYKTKMEKF